MKQLISFMLFFLLVFENPLHAQAQEDEPIKTMTIYLDPESCGIDGGMCSSLQTIREGWTAPQTYLTQYDSEKKRLFVEANASAKEVIWGAILDRHCRSVEFNPWPELYDGMTITCPCSCGTDPPNLEKNKHCLPCPALETPESVIKDFQSMD